MSKYDIAAIRSKMAQTSGRVSDPDEFKPARADSGTIRYRFFILPPVMKGETLKGGEVQQGMDNFYIPFGQHWVDNKPHSCPRVWSGENCDICTYGFDLLRDEKDENVRRQIVKTWMPTTFNVVNIFFPNWNENPEELRGKVKWYKAPKTCFDLWTECIMRDDPGDEDMPEAYGAFFDENAAFLFELRVTKKGSHNSYETSKFVPHPVPMIKNSDGSPNEAAIEKLLRHRHNLFDKLEAPDLERIKRVFVRMTDGDDGIDDEDAGFDHDEQAASTNDEAKPEAKEKPKSKVVKEDDDDVIDSGSDEGDLADEVPFTDDDDSASTSDSSGDDDDDIESLLSQL